MRRKHRSSERTLIRERRDMPLCTMRSGSKAHAEATGHYTGHGVPPRTAPIHGTSDAHYRELGIHQSHWRTS